MVKRIALIGVSMCVMTGCAASMNQDFHMSGSAEGIRAFSDGLVGVSKTAKEGPDSPNQYLAHRGQQEREITRRSTADGFLGKLFAPSSSVGSGTATSEGYGS